MSGGHHFLAPSSADIWVYCAGAPLMASQYPEQETLDTQEGDASHWIVSDTLLSYKSPDVSIKMPSSFIDVEAPNGIIINDDMVFCAEVMIDDVLSVCQEHGLLSHMHVEERMEIPRIHALNGGTPDVWIFDVRNLKLYLWDFKYGHKDVPADSWQNKNYIAGILDKIDAPDTDVDVEMTIVQPRSYHGDGPIKRYQCKASDLRPDFNKLESQAILAVSSEPGVVSGPHCRYCPARHACGAARGAAANAVDVAMSAIPEVLTVEGLSFELALLERAIKAIEHRYEAIKEDAITRIVDNGDIIPGYGTKHGSGRRVFTATSPQLEMLGDLIGINMMDDPKPITPAEFDRRLVAVNKQRKADGKEVIDKSVISGYVDTPTTGIKLVPIDQTLAIKAFKQRN